MGPDTAICAENLGKMYKIGGREPSERYVALRDVLARGPQRLWRNIRGYRFAPKVDSNEFWALKGLNFEIKRGEVVGLIGRNGAGKSTLLKILSRITEPSSGRVVIRGRISSLLEVGTGFHPELTGRENIFLNGAVLGMRRGEIKGRFDEIVAFAGVERFLDTPVKRYSSGMYVRLAFAVAAHLESEILIIDEVLAVGDAEFQKRCLGKLNDVAGSGRTVLFVSHNLGAVSALCTSGMVLDKGKLVCHSTATTAMSHYKSLQADSSHSLDISFDGQDRSDRSPARLTRVRLKNLSAPSLAWARPLDNLRFVIDVDVNGEVHNLSILLEIRDGMGYTVAKTESRPVVEANPGSWTTSCDILVCPLMPGEYSVSFATAVYGVRLLDWQQDRMLLTVLPHEIHLESAGPSPAGSIYLQSRWENMTTANAEPLEAAN